MARPSVDMDLKTFLGALRKQRARVGNGFFRDHLGWNEDRYNKVREMLIERGKVVRGRGRGGTVDVA